VQPLSTPSLGPARRRARVIPAKPLASLVVIASFTAVLYVSEAVDTALGGALDQDGIIPRRVDGLDGVLWAPLLHAGWPHLLANTVPILVLGFLATAGGFGQFVAVTAMIWIVGGLGTWLTGGPNTVHIGASGLIFGWLTFLLVRGFFARSFGQIVLAVALFGLYGGVLLGVLPGQPGISWQGHLFGALGGLLAAWMVASADRPRAAKPAV
jgi:membrane associated rhomboid family serine protease